MKIGVISSTVFQLPITNYGGLEVIAWECARGLANKGHEVFLFAPDNSTCQNVTIVPFGPAGMIGEKEAYSGFGELKDQQGNIVRRKHLGYWPTLLEMNCVLDHSWQKYSYLMKAERMPKTPIISTLHAPVKTMYSSLPPVENPCFVVISEDQGKVFEALFDRPCRVVYNGIDLSHYVDIGIHRTDRFLFLARFSSIKCPDIAIKACLEAGVGLDLIGDTTITGEPEYFQECLRLAERESPGWDRSKGKQIKVIGGVSRGETVWWYSRAKCMLHPNQRFREPYGLAPVEAQSCCCPVIAWDFGAMRETVRHGETGFLVKSFNELVNYIKTDAVKTIDRNRCREWVKKFSIENMVNRYNDLIHEAVETGGW